MYFTNKRLPVEIIAALQKVEIILYSGRKTFKGNPPEIWIVRMSRLDRQHYNIFKNVLEDINGKWDLGLDGHVFHFDPKDVLTEVISVGMIPQRKPHDAFFTPEEVVKEMIDWADFHYCEETSHWNYLEPQAGQGAILDVVCEKYPGMNEAFTCCEIDSFNRSILQKKGYKVVDDNFLETDFEPIYNWVIMNPPFNGKAGDYVAHVKKAFSLLAPKGRLVSVVPQSFLTSTVKQIEDFRNEVFKYGEHADLPDEAFKASGTSIKCCMIKMTNYSDSAIQEFEAVGTYYDTWDCYTGPIVVALEGDAIWYKQVAALVKDVKLGKIKSEKIFLENLESFSDRIVRRKIWEEECSFRWDTLVRKRTIHSLFETIIEREFANANPFASREPRQLSLFG